MTWTNQFKVSEVGPTNPQSIKEKPPSPLSFTPTSSLFAPLLFSPFKTHFSLHFNHFAPTYQKKLPIHLKQKNPIALDSNPAREVPRPPPNATGDFPPMSDTHAPFFPPARVTHAPQNSLYKQRSWSPDMGREEAWLRRKRRSGGERRSMKSRSVTDEDLDELKACIELGFGFDSPEPADQRLADTLPALGFYYAVNKHYNDSLSRPAAVTTPSNSSTPSECDSPSPLGSPHTMFGPDDTPQTVKTRLRQWAQVVACSVRQSTS